ncbi:Aste57867_15937 [Aphanomyces stellatus]|uniref:Aste57867_15937 protein n=1 Tax=Aphanomyces stellatus TaxID=120398 RepID=A0A485L4U7_9STRA|nr:hypothetical protein As57867_015881 [Aphanomyces stellatus]VFT92723.1 Aste57867_15937 [Aphanomyces stellatus]
MEPEPVAIVGAPDVKVIVDEPPLQVGAWKASLFSCCDSCVPNCLCSTFCPCITLGQIVARLGVGDCFVTAAATFLLSLTGFGAIFVWLYLWYIRSKFRAFFSIPGSCCGDCCATLICGCCVRAQLATHAGSYTHGRCTMSAKSTLPGYNFLAAGATPLAVPDSKV